MQMTIKSILTLALGSSVLGLASCKKEGGVDAEARIMVTHASPGGQPVDVLVDNQKVNSSAVAYGTSTGYISVASGERNLKLNAAGSSNTAVSSNYNFAGNTSYSVFAVNNSSSISTIAVGDNLATPAAGKAHVRFFHLSPGAPGVTVGVGTGSSFSALFSNRSFETQSTAEANAAFTAVDAGTYTVEVRIAGTTTAVLSTPVTLTAGKIYTIYARGQVGSTTAPLGAGVIVHN